MLSADCFAALSPRFKAQGFGEVKSIARLTRDGFVTCRAIAKQAEAERERRAKVIHAQGELQASEKLLAAAKVLAEQSEAIQLRYLQTLTDIAGDKSSTIVFPLPGDLLGTINQFTRNNH